jgi:2-C-methyl-D-erythritol 2,4-cyclodiphosphate synthase
MILGGVAIECDYSIEAHSDGDIIVHALIDALLGAAAYGDLGTYFPSEDETMKDISSFSMLSSVLNKLKDDSYKIINIDLTYVGQVPKLITYREEIRNNLSKFMNINIENISCKATTTDGLGFEGSLEGISCHCIVLIER